MSFLIAQVAVEVSSYTFDKPYSYRIPDSLADEVKPGVRVTVPFGAGNRKKQGMVLNVGTDSELEKIKPILTVLDKEPILNEEMLKLALWLKDNTFCTLFDAVRTMLPAGINVRIFCAYRTCDGITKENLDELMGDRQRVVSYLLKCSCPVEKGKILAALGIDEESDILKELEDEGYLERTDEAVRKIGDATVKMVRLAADIDTENTKLPPKQSKVVELLMAAGAASVKEITYFTGASSAVINSLNKKGITEYFENEIYRNPYADICGGGNPREIKLTESQQKAYDGLLEKYNSGKGGVSLLYGVTGSGKTSVFLKLIDNAVRDNRGVIAMVPEIALTPQTLEKFHERYGNKVAVFHSSLSVGQRLDEWKRVKNGDALIAVGTRSAVFAPFENLGLIIMDEEQEHTYKSESSPRYHARNVAKFRCAYHNAQLVLASATPSVESFYNAQKGRYSLFKLPERYGNAVLPKVEIIDMKNELLTGNTSRFSSRLCECLEENLNNGKQSILLLNRRGYNTFVGCRICDHIMTCPNCSISMTYHSANGRLMCHYCGYSEEYTQTCPKCGEKNMRYSGVGTQKAEEELSQLFPQARILRMDADTTMAKNSYDRKLRDFADGDYDIMIGTQMVAKGLDFHNVTLVGVICADQSLFSDDFRSYERAFSLLTQVVGRSGRGEEAGVAVIQTYSPEHSVIELAAKQDYDSFYSEELPVRRMMLYPPFSDICLISFSGENEELTAQAARDFLHMFKNMILTEYSDLPVRTLGPSSPAIAKISNKYRYKLIIKCKNTSNFRELISVLLKKTGSDRKYKGITVTADMNPENVN